MNSLVTAYPDALPEATSTSLSLPESLTFEQWEEIGAELANRARKLNWWIGDWWAAGHHRYGERARLAARGLFGKEFKTLANIASVCRAFEPSRRREHLSWSHHAEASALSPNAADMLLDLAERDRLSKAQVRAAVTTIRGGPSARAVSPDEAAVASLFRAYNRLPEQVRVLVAQAFAAVAVTGAEIDPATGDAKAHAPANELEPLPDDAAAETIQATPEPQEAIALEPELETAAEAEPEAALDLAEWESFSAEAEVPAAAPAAEPPLDLAPDMEATPAPETYIEYDLTLDMAALEAPLDLAPEMEAPSPESIPNSALDLDLDMAMEETRSAPDHKSALNLGPEMEEGEEGDTPRKARARNEPWLLP